MHACPPRSSFITIGTCCVGVSYTHTCHTYIVSMDISPHSECIAPWTVAQGVFLTSHRGGSLLWCPRCLDKPHLATSTSITSPPQLPHATRPAAAPARRGTSGRLVCATGGAAAAGSTARGRREVLPITRSRAHRAPRLRPARAAPRPPRTARCCMRAPARPCGRATPARRPGSAPSQCAPACAPPAPHTPPPRSPRTASAGTSPCHMAGSSRLHSTHPVTHSTQHASRPDFRLAQAEVTYRPNGWTGIAPATRRRTGTGCSQRFAADRHSWPQHAQHVIDSK